MKTNTGSTSAMPARTAALSVALLVVLVCWGATQWPVGSLTKDASFIGEGLQGRSPWPMEGGNARRTRQSRLLGPQRGRLKWMSRATGMIVDSPAIAADGTIYVGSLNGYFYALQRDGILKWRLRIGTKLLYNYFSSPAIAKDGTIYVGTDDGLCAIIPGGTIRWKYHTKDGMSQSSPVIGPNGIIYVGAGDHNLYAIRSDGSLQWKYPIQGVVHSSPSLGVDGTIYVGSSDRHLYAIRPDGMLRWKYQVDSEIGDPSIAEDGTIYFNTEGNFYAVQMDGSLRWKRGDMARSSVAEDGTIYAVSPGGVFHAMRPNGRDKWTLDIGDQGGGSAIGVDGTIYVTADDRVLALSPLGLLKWKSPILGRCGAPVIGMNGTLLIDTFNSLCAIQ